MKNTEWVALCPKACGLTTSSSTMILNLASKETLDWQDGNQMETKEWKQGYLEHSDYAQSGQISEKTDVYSYGVVLVEFVTGRKAVDLSRPKGQQCLREVPGAQTLILFSSHSTKKSLVQTANPVCGHRHHLPLLDSFKAHTDNLTPEKYAILSMIQDPITRLIYPITSSSVRS